MKYFVLLVGAALAFSGEASARQFTGCSQAERDRILAVERIADEASSGLASETAARSEVHRNRGEQDTAARLRHASKVLSCTKKKIGKVGYKCHGGNEAGCSGGVLAYVYAIKTPFGTIGGYKVHLCDAFWEFVQQDANPELAAAAVFVHEGSHLCGTNDADYFHHGEKPRDVGASGWQTIADTYRYWVNNGLCVPGQDC